jgi:hypothetical protein
VSRKLHLQRQAFHYLTMGVHNAKPQHNDMVDYLAVFETVWVVHFVLLALLIAA